MTQGNTRLARQLLWFAAFINVPLLCMMCSFTANGGWLGALLLLLAVDVSVAAYAISQGLVFELLQERTWKAVCSGIGFSGMARSMRGGLYGAYVKGETKTIYPKLRNVHGTREGWTGIVTPFAGQTIEDYTKQADAFALAFHVPFVTFGLAENGLISIRAGEVPVPAAYAYTGQLATRPAMPRTQVLAPVASPAPRLSAPVQSSVTLAYARALLQAVPMARDMNGLPWSMPIEGQHVFIAARTGGGKGSFIWSLVLGLAPAWRAGLVTFWGCDPKRLELAIGRDWWTHYADTAEDMVSLLEQCVREMHERAAQLQGKVRKFTPSLETPLNVVVVDELGFITAWLPDKKLRARAEDAIATLLSQGRAVGYSLVGAVQDPRKETVGFRDLFPIRIAGGLPAPMVDLVLGEGSHHVGAFCEQIPLGNAGAGVGYVISETSLKPLCVRAAWCGDEVIKRLLTEPRAHTANRDTDEGMTGQLDWNGQPLYQWGYQGE